MSRTTITIGVLVLLFAFVTYLLAFGPNSEKNEQDLKNDAEQNLLDDSEQDLADDSETESVNDNEQDLADDSETESVNDNEEKNEEEEANVQEISDEEKLITQEQFIQCLKENNVVIFGSVTCPYCAQLVDSLGGYEVVAPIYVECSEDPTRCRDEMQTRGVPEIQIDGVLYQGGRSPAQIGAAAGCVLDR
jgi:hypothetical protein